MLQKSADCVWYHRKCYQPSFKLKIIAIIILINTQHPNISSVASTQAGPLAFFILLRKILAEYKEILLAEFWCSRTTENNEIKKFTVHQNANCQSKQYMTVSWWTVLLLRFESCTDLESFVRGGPTLAFFCVFF